MQHIFYKSFFTYASNVSGANTEAEMSAFNVKLSGIFGQKI